MSIWGDAIVQDTRDSYLALKKQTLDNQYILSHGGTLGTRTYYDTPSTTQYNGNTTANTVLTGTSNTDTINNAAPYVTINGGAGNDSIINDRRGTSYTLAGAYSNVDGGNGNDYIDNKEWCDFSFVSGGSGDDTILNRAGGSTVSGGTGNDSIQNITGGILISGDSGNDIIIDTGAIGKGNTITGSAGNDTISLESAAGNDLIQYANGDGNDAIIGFGATDTLSISGDNYSTTKSGSDLIVTVGTGTITLVGAGNTSPNIIGTYGSSTIAPETVRRFVFTPATVAPETVAPATVTPDPTPVDPTPEPDPTPTPVDLTPVTPIYSPRIYAGGDQVITDYQSGEQIFLGTMPTGYIFGGGNFAMTSATGTLFIANANDKIINFVDGAGNDFAKAYAATYPGVIDLRDLAGYEVINGSDYGADAIFAGDGGSQLWGGNGVDSDTLVGGAGADVFIGGKMQGSDVMMNAASTDVVFLNDALLGDIVAAAGDGGAVAIAFNTGNVVMVQSSEPLSAAFMLADGSAYRYNHVAQAWQTA